ncbi:hypothetical protein ACS0TY_026828 [Phlomoides rotata]
MDIKEWKEQFVMPLEIKIKQEKEEIKCLDILDDVFGLDKNEAEIRRTCMNELNRHLLWKEAEEC